MKSCIPSSLENTQRSNAIHIFSSRRARWRVWPSGESVLLDLVHSRPVCWLPAEHSGHLCNLHCTRGLCRLSLQWLILAYSCPWWYVKYSVASLFLSFLWSLCRNVSGLQVLCLRAELGDWPLLTFLHEKWNFMPNLRRFFSQTKQDWLIKGAAEFSAWADVWQGSPWEQDSVKRAGPNGMCHCLCRGTGDPSLGKNILRIAL